MGRAKRMDNYNSPNFDWEQKLIVDASYELNGKQTTTVYCFSKYQAEEIMSRCVFKTNYTKDGEIYTVYVENSVKDKRNKYGGKTSTL